MILKHLVRLLFYLILIPFPVECGVFRNLHGSALLWSVAYEFSSPGDALNPLKNSMHPFEMVTYLFKGRNLGYSIITDKCASCTSPANVIDRIGRDNIPGRPSDTTGRPATVHNEPGVPAVRPDQQVRRPVVIR